MNEYIINKLYLDDNQYVKSYYGTTGIWKKYYNVDTDFVTIELDSPGLATLTAARKGDWRCDLFYSFDRKTWTAFNDLHDTGTGDITVTVEFTNKIYLKGDTYSGKSDVLSQYITLKVNSLHSVSGNLMSLVDNDTIRSTMFYNLFNVNEYLTDASGLILPDDTDTNCYYCMFAECSRLTAAPELPATRLAGACYYKMFFNCTSLVNVPEFTITSFSGLGACEQMFAYCSSLESVNMNHIGSVASQNCFKNMFYSCSSLITAPELPATILGPSCYKNMFYNCTSLVNAPELPAITLSTECYSFMFYNCTSLITAPELPATTLYDSCYESMLRSCTSLTKTPILRASTLVSRCYSSMFAGCTSLSIATVLATDVSATDCLFNIFAGIHNNCVLKKIKGVDYSNNIYPEWTQTDVFYLVNREKQSDKTGRWAWHGYENQEDWTATAWTNNLENENFLMYCDSDNYLRNMLNDVKIWSSWHSQYNFDDIKLYSVTDTDSKQVFLPCGYGYYTIQGRNEYRIWMARYNGIKDYSSNPNLQDFITTWGYGRNSTFIASYEKKYYRYIEPPIGDEIYRITSKRGTLCMNTSTITNNDCVYMYNYNSTKPGQADDLFSVVENDGILYISKTVNGTTYYMYNAGSQLKFTDNYRNVNLSRLTWTNPIDPNYNYYIIDTSNKRLNISNYSLDCPYTWATPTYPCSRMDTYSVQDDGNAIKFEDTTQPTTIVQLLDSQYFNNMTVGDSVDFLMTNPQTSTYLSYISTGNISFTALTNISSKQDLINKLNTYSQNPNYVFTMTKTGTGTATIVHKSTGKCVNYSSTTWAVQTPNNNTISFPTPGDTLGWHSWITVPGDSIRITQSGNHWNNSGGNYFRWASGQGGYSTMLFWAIS